MSRISDADIGLRRVLTGSALPTIPQSASRGSHFRGFTGSLSRYGLSGCSPPCTDQTGFPRPARAFTSRLSTGQSPFPLPDMTTTVTGLLCWRDLHPLEWQLASLHQNHLTDIVAIDMFVVATATFRLLYALIVLGHGRRRVMHFNVTQYPTQAWLSRQLIEAFPWDNAPRYLLRDRGRIVWSGLPQSRSSDGH